MNFDKWINYWINIKITTAVMSHLKSIEKDRKAFADAVNALGEPLK